MYAIRVGRFLFHKSPEGEIRVMWFGHGTPIKSDPDYREPTADELQTLEEHLSEGYQWVPVTP